MTFQEENDKLLCNILDKLFFTKWRKSNDDTNDRQYTLEFYFTTTCNQHCEYCYLQRYDKMLYPQEYNKFETIIENTKRLYEWIINNKYIGCINVDFYSGEIWHTKLGEAIFDLTLEYLDKGLPFKRITIPTNGSFLLTKESTERMRNYRRKFLDKGCLLTLSLSIDGAIVDKRVRPLRSSEDEDKRIDDFYERAFEFAVSERLCFHPMLAAKSVKYWKENLDWWLEMCKKYDLYFIERVGILEVRNNDWNEEALKDYEEFLDYYNERYKVFECSNNEEQFMRHIFETAGICGGVDNTLQKCGSQLGCTNPRQLTIRVGDLAIASCHRTAYNELLFGYLNPEENKITSKNVYVAMKALTGDMNTVIAGCDSCKYKSRCMKQCLGACKEYKNDPFMIEPSVCKLLKTRIKHLVGSYEKKAYFEKYKEMCVNKSEYDELISFRDNILKEEE